MRCYAYFRAFRERDVQFAQEQLFRDFDAAR